MSTELAEARLRLIEALGRQSAFWGVGKAAGEMYAALYLAREPLSLAQLAEVLNVTKGSVSVGIRVLEGLGMVRRSQRRGDRRVFFEAEPDFWVIARRVLERRQKPEFDESFRLVDESLALAQTAPDSDEHRFVVTRLQALLRFYQQLDTIVETLLMLDPKRLAQLAQWARRLRPPGQHSKGRG